MDTIKLLKFENKKLMKALIIYATYAGSTYMVAEKLANIFKQRGDEVEMVKAPEVNIDNMFNYDLIIMGSPSWDTQGKEGMPHGEILDLMNRTGDRRFDGKNFAIFGLGNTTYDKFCGAVDHMEKFIKNKGGNVVGQPLKIDNYYLDNDIKMDQIQKWADQLVS